MAQVGFDETGQEIADMAVDVLGEESDELASSSVTPDAANAVSWAGSADSAVSDTVNAPWAPQLQTLRARFGASSGRGGSLP